MRAVWWLGLVSVLAAPFAVQGDASPQVILATPGSTGPQSGAIERFTLRFSEAMVPLGDPRADSAATSDCPVTASGRWTDEQTFVLDFEKPLPASTTCKVTLREGLATQRGAQIGGIREFNLDTGGPRVRSVFAPGYDGDIDEDQVFLVAVSGAVDRASVAANASCAVDGIGEAIAVDMLGEDEPGKILEGLGKSNWERNNFLTEQGLSEDLPKDPAARRAALVNILALKCRRPLPPEKDMALLWPKSIAGPSGKLAGSDQRFEFKIRQSFTARFECDRVNAQAGCNPIQPAHVRFSAPVPRATAMAVRLKLADGTLRQPKVDDETKGQAELSDLDFEGPFPANSEATVVLPAEVIDLSGRKLANAERFPLVVKFDAAPPLVKFAANFGIVEASEGGVLPVTVRAVEESLGGKITAIAGKSAKIESDDAAIAEWLRKLAKADDSDFESVEQKDGTTIYINHTGEKPILTGTSSPLKLAMPGKGKDFEVVGIPLKQNGFHIIELASPALGAALLGRETTRYVAAGALVTNMAVHFQWGRENSLAWVTALTTGKPVANAVVAVSDSCTGKRLASGKTDSSGRLLIEKGLPPPDAGGGCDEEESHPLLVIARTSDDMSFTLTSWSQGITPWDIDLPYGWEPGGDILHTVFDRALARIGETVHMKHILRHPEGAGFALAKGFTGKLLLTHMGSDTQFSLPVTIGADGSGESAWTAPQGAPLGDYGLKFESADGTTISTGQSVRVDEYRLPTMRATITGPSEALVKPSNVPLSLFVGYLSGGGAGQLPVTLRTDFSPYWSTPSGYEGYEFGGEAVQEGTRPLDNDGNAEQDALPLAQTLPATLGTDGTAKTSVEVGQTVTRPMTLQVEMDYPDANGETLTQSKWLMLYPSALQLGVKTDGWLMRNDDLRLKFVTLDLKGKPVAGQTIKVALYSRQTITARRRLIGGFYAYDNQEKVTRLSKACLARTDQQGLAQCQIDPGLSGEVTVVATSTDDAGRESRAVRTVWLAGEDEWWFGGDNGDRMDLIPEQKEYKAGETAKLQVRMPFREATALVTVQREGVLSSFVTTLSGKNPVVEVKMPGSYAPNVFVSVMAVRGRVSGMKLWLADMARRWNLPWLSREGSNPTATVDLAKPSYRIGVTQLKVGWEAHKLAVGVKPERDKYAVRDVAKVGIAVLGPDGKPARSADVAFMAVDDALLQLAPNRSTDLLDAMMGERSLEVVTSTGQMQVVGKRHYGKKAVAAGGGGGDASGVNRENFQPVLLWKGHVALDANGTAVVQVPLSDALSRFRLVAVASDGAQLFGSGEARIKTSQNLSIFPGLAPLVRTGDLYDALFTLRNGSDRDMRVTATPTIEPAFAKGNPLTVNIKAGGAATVRWSLTAPAAAGPVKWTIEARSEDGKNTDTLTAMQEVIPALPAEAWAASLVRTGDGGPINIAPPAGALAGGWVDIALSNSLAPPLDGVRSYMTQYPYECFEQRLSRIVATGNSGAWTVLAGSLPTFLDKDGLLKYWPSESIEGSPELTAYAVAMTSAAGLQVPGKDRARMIAALRSVAEGRLSRSRSFDGDERLVRIAAVSALARAGAVDATLIGTVDMVPADMPTGTLADWIVALDKAPVSARITQLRAGAEGEMRRRFAYEGARLDLVDQQKAPWWMMTSGDEMAVKALEALLGKSGWAAEAPRMMTGVAQRQSGGHWDTTPANAWGAVLVRRFAALYPASAITGTTTVSLGSASQSARWPRKVDASPLRLPLATGPLTLSQSGGGAGPWATVTVRAAVPLSKPLYAGYRLTREVKVISARQAGRLSQGDVVRIKLTVEASADRNWVVLSDPLPSGATVVSGMGGQSALLKGGESSDGSYPAWVESQRGSWRAFYEWLPRGKTLIEYTVRLNGAGRFVLPPSRVEAMYSPQIRAQLPLAPVQVWAP